MRRYRALRLVASEANILVVKNRSKLNSVAQRGAINKIRSCFSEENPATLVTIIY
jgi:hypothetical protein